MNINAYYDFNTIAPTTLGLSYRGVKLIRIELLRDAINTMDVTTVNTTVSIETGVTVPYDVNNAEFYVFEVNGNEMVFSQHWLDIDSLTVTVKKDITIELENINISDIPSIEQYLAKMGHSFKIKL